MTRPTAVAAPAAEPFDELFAYIDGMTGRELREFVAKLRSRIVVTAIEPRDVQTFAVPVTLKTTITFGDGTAGSQAWVRWLNQNGWVVS